MSQKSGSLFDMQFITSCISTMLVLLLLGMVVFFVMTANNDFLKEQAPLMTAALERCGVPCVYRCYGDETQKLGHVFHCNIRAEAAQNCNTEECGFFKRFME